MNLGKLSGLFCMVPLLAAIGCGIETAPNSAGTPAVGQVAEELFQVWQQWPSGIVPVCWDAITTLRPDFAVRSAEVRRLAINSWPSVANVKFTGWGTCPVTTGGEVVRIVLNDSVNANGCRGYDANTPCTMNLGVNRADFAGGLVPHEFGHTLGFAHEMARDGFPDQLNSSCAEGNVTGETLDTPVDFSSIMASTGYCHNNTNLSVWDIVGAQKLYGTRTDSFRILVNSWNAGREDNALAGSPYTRSTLRDAGYTNAYVEGWAFADQAPSTVPLKLYWNAARGDHMTVATAASEAAAVGAGYSFVRTEGFVYSTAVSGTSALKTYWNANRGDHMMVATTDSETRAINDGYTFVRTEGYVFSGVPYSLLWNYWNAGRGDNLAAGQNSASAIAADDAGYSWVGFDNVVMKNAVPGTAYLDIYWHPTREDHFTLSNQASRVSAIGAGYSYVGNAGFVFIANMPGAKALTSCWSAAREDHFSTADVVPAGYYAVRNEGYVLGALD